MPATSGIRRLVLPVLLVLVAAAASACDATTAKSQGGPGKSALDGVKDRGVLRAGIRTDNPPHSFFDSSGRWVGFDVDIAQGLADELGVRLERVKVDELTRISYLQNGKIDVAVASMSHTRKRDAAVDYSQTYFFSKQTFLVKKGRIKSLKDLVGERVGADRGSSGPGNWRDWLVRHGYRSEPEIVLFSNKQAAVQAVEQGAIAGFTEDYEIHARFAKKHPGLTVLGGEGTGVKLDGVGVRENDSKLLDAVNFALQRLWTSGRYQRIYNRWFGRDSDTPVPLQGEIEVWPNG
jgi:polar amino acid transport system substrate-binding protein